MLTCATSMEDAYESFVVKQFPRVPYVMPAAVQIISTSPPHAILAPRPPTLRDSSTCASSENSTRAEPLTSCTCRHAEGFFP